MGYVIAALSQSHSTQLVLQRQFALKKIRCPSGQEDVRQAMREVEAYRRFK